jgi:hypothetical protein
MPSVSPSGATSPTIFLQESAPNAVSAFAGSSQLYPVPFIDDLWVDKVNHLLKQCTSVNPYTWISVSSGGIGPNFSDAEVPSGAINGVNTVFNLVNSPNPAKSLSLYLNGVIQTGGGIDYTLAGATITFVVAPATGDTIIAWYRF